MNFLLLPYLITPYITLFTLTFQKKKKNLFTLCMVIFLLTSSVQLFQGDYLDSEEAYGNRRSGEKLTSLFSSVTMEQPCVIHTILIGHIMKILNIGLLIMQVP